MTFTQYEGDKENIHLDVKSGNHFLGSIYREVANGQYYFHPVNNHSFGWTAGMLTEIANKLISLSS